MKRQWIWAALVAMGVVFGGLMGSHPTLRAIVGRFIGHRRGCRSIERA